MFSKQIKYSISIMLFITVIFAVNGNARAKKAVIEVPVPMGPEHDLTNIQSAIDAANDGDTIELAAGIYILDGSDPGTDVEIFTPGGSFFYRESVLSWFTYDPDGLVETGAWLDTRGKSITIEGRVNPDGTPATTITTNDLLKANFLLVHSKSVQLRDLRFQDSVAAIMAFSPIHLENVEFQDVFYPVSAYVDSRFAHPNWDPVDSPDDFSETIPVIWKNVTYKGACGQSHVFMSAWQIHDSTFYTQQYEPWGPYWFYSSIFTGAIPHLFSVYPAWFGGVNIPVDVMALSVFRDFIVQDSVFISNGTWSGLDISNYYMDNYATITGPTYVGNITIKDNTFQDTDGYGLSIWSNGSSSAISNIVIKDNIFENVDIPLTLYSSGEPLDVIQEDNIIR